MSWETKLPNQLCEWLKQREIPALTGWTGVERSAMAAPAVLVTVKEYSACSAGFEDYLGEQYNEEKGTWEELYGRKAEVILGLDLYAPERESEQSLQTLLERLISMLTLEIPDGLQVGNITCGQTKWDEGQRRIKREVSARCTLWLHAVCSEGTEFLDFELRGGWKH